MLCSKQGGKPSQKESKTLRAVASPALVSLYHSEVLPLLDYVVLKIRLRDAQDKLIEAQQSIRRTSTYLANATADEQWARAGSKKAERAAHLKEKHTNVLRKHESGALRAKETLIRTRAAFELEQRALALSTLFDPFDNISECVVDAGSGTEQGTPGARGRGDDDDHHDGIPPSAKKPRIASTPLAPCPHTPTPTPAPPCVLPLERTDVMTCILAYLSCGDALNGLGMASRATRAAVMGAATSVSIRQGTPCTVLRGFPLLQHLTVLHYPTPATRHDWWDLHSTAWHAQLTRAIAPRLVTLSLPLSHPRVDTEADVMSLLCSITWPHLRHLHVTGEVAALLRDMEVRRLSVFPSLEAVGYRQWQAAESTALHDAIRAGCLPCFRSLDCLGVDRSTHPHTTEVFFNSRNSMPQLTILMAARSTRRVWLLFPCMYTHEDGEGGWKAALPRFLDVLREVRFPELRHLRLGAPLEVVRQILECLVEVGIATHLHSLRLSIAENHDPPLPPQQYPTGTHTHTHTPSTWLLPANSFPTLTSINIGGACTHEGLVAVLGACGTRLQSVYLHDSGPYLIHATYGSDHLSALHTVVCGGGGDGKTNNRAGATDALLCSGICGNAGNGEGPTNGSGSHPPWWTTSVTQLKLTVPEGKVMTESHVASTLKDVMRVLPSLQQLTLSCVRDGAVVGVLEAKHAGALHRLRKLDFDGARRYGLVEALSNGAGLLLLAWLKKERHRLAKGLKVAHFWGDPARRELVEATGLSSCWTGDPPLLRHTHCSQ